MVFNFLIILTISYKKLYLLIFWVIKSMLRANGNGTFISEILFIFNTSSVLYKVFYVGYLKSIIIVNIIWRFSNDAV